jgi:chorismate synthase
VLKFASAGESHGPAIVALLEGIPAGLALDLDAIDADLRRRQLGFGRGGRMALEHDKVEVVAGLVQGRTSGAPLLLRIANRDASLASKPPLHRPRPGHADLAGAFKWLTDDARPVLERASARETCARVAAAAVVRQLLRRAGIEVFAFVDAIGGVAAEVDREAPIGPGGPLARARDRSEVACPDARASKRMVAAIRAAAVAGDTLGGSFVVVADGVPPGLGTCAQWDERLDGRLAQAVMSIPAIKGVEIGLGFAAATRPGSEVHDDIRWRRSPGRYGGVARGSDRAGGLEGGITNGERILVRAAMKPISTLRKPLRSIDLRRRTAALAAYERSDVCSVPAASVVGEAMVLLALGREFLAKFGGDSLRELDAHRAAYERALRRQFGRRGRLRELR